MRLLCAVSAEKADLQEQVNAKVDEIKQLKEQITALKVRPSDYACNYARIHAIHSWTWNRQTEKQGTSIGADPSASSNLDKLPHDAPRVRRKLTGHFGKVQNYDGSKQLHQLKLPLATLGVCDALGC